MVIHPVCWDQIPYQRFPALDQFESLAVLHTAVEVWLKRNKIVIVSIRRQINNESYITGLMYSIANFTCHTNLVQVEIFVCRPNVYDANIFYHYIRNIRKSGLYLKKSIYNYSL